MIEGELEMASLELLDEPEAGAFEERELRTARRRTVAAPKGKISRINRNKSKGRPMPERTRAVFIQPRPETDGCFDVPQESPPRENVSFPASRDPLEEMEP